MGLFLKNLPGDLCKKNCYLYSAHGRLSWCKVRSIYFELIGSSLLNGDTKSNAENGVDPILCLCICFISGTMLNYLNVYENANVTCEQALTNVKPQEFRTEKKHCYHVVTSRISFWKRNV